MSETKAGIIVLNDGKCTRYYTLPSHEQCLKIIESVLDPPHINQNYNTIYKVQKDWHPIAYIVSTDSQTVKYSLDLRLLTPTSEGLNLRSIPQTIKNELSSSYFYLGNICTRTKELHHIFAKYKALFQANIPTSAQLSPKPFTYTTFTIYQPMNQSTLPVWKQETVQLQSESESECVCEQEACEELEKTCNRQLTLLKLNGGIIILKNAKNRWLWMTIPTHSQQTQILEHMVPEGVDANLSLEVTNAGTPLLYITYTQGNKPARLSIHLVHLYSKKHAGNKSTLECFKNTELPQALFDTLKEQNKHLADTKTRQKTLETMFKKHHVSKVQKPDISATYNIYGYEINKQGKSMWYQKVNIPIA